MGLFKKKCRTCVYYHDVWNKKASCWYDETPKEIYYREKWKCENYVKLKNKRSDKIVAAAKRCNYNQIDYNATISTDPWYFEYAASEFTKVANENPIYRTKAVKWCLKCNFKKILDLVYLYGNGGFEQVTDESICKKWNEILNNHYKSVLKNDDKFMLSFFYFHGAFVEKNIKKAINLCMEAAESGDVRAKEFIEGFLKRHANTMNNEDKYDGYKFTYKVIEEASESYATMIINLENARQQREDERLKKERLKKLLKEAKTYAEYKELGDMYFCGAGLSAPDLLTGVNWYIMAAKEMKGTSFCNFANSAHNVLKDVKNGKYDRQLGKDKKKAEALIDELYKEEVRKEREEEERKRKEREEKNKREWEKKERERISGIIEMAEQGKARACINAAEILFKGNSMVEKDPDKAIRMLMTAHNMRYDYCQMDSWETSRAERMLEEYYSLKESELVSEKTRSEWESKLKYIRAKREEELKQKQKEADDLHKRMVASIVAKGEARRAAEEKERKRKSEPCYKCKWFVEGLDWDLETRDDGIYRVPNPKKYYCNKLKNQPAVDRYGHCDLFERDTTKTMSEAGYRKG